MDVTTTHTHTHTVPISAQDGHGLRQPISYRCDQQIRIHEGDPVTLQCHSSFTDDIIVWKKYRDERAKKYIDSLPKKFISIDLRGDTTEPSSAEPSTAETTTAEPSTAEPSTTTTTVIIIPIYIDTYTSCLLIPYIVIYTIISR